MHDVLEAISRHKDVTHGVLRITSNHASGMIGVFCGRFLTGAVLILSGEQGYGAMKRLLCAKDGSFAFMDTEGEPLPDLRQSLGVDIAMLLASVDFENNDLPVSEEYLTGMRPSVEVNLIDTDVDLAFDEFEDVEAKRMDRINETYDRLVSLSEHTKAEEAKWGEDPKARRRPEGDYERRINEATHTATDGGATPTAPIPHPMTSKPTTPEQQAILNLKAKQQLATNTPGTIALLIIGLILVVGVVGAFVLLGSHPH